MNCRNAAEMISIIKWSLFLLQNGENSLTVNFKNSSKFENIASHGENHLAPKVLILKAGIVAHAQYSRWCVIFECLPQIRQSLTSVQWVVHLD